MFNKKKNNELRIILGALLLSCGILCYAIYDTYYEDMSAQLAQQIAENLPEFKNELAGR